MGGHVFISHAAGDRALATETCTLFERSGIPCWIAPRDIQPGQKYAEAIIDAIEHCAAMVLILSETANNSLHVQNEIERAVSKRKRVLPVRAQPVEPSKALELFVSSAHWVDAWDGKLKTHIGALVEAVKPLMSEQPEGNGGGRPHVVPSISSARGARRATPSASLWIALGMLGLIGAGGVAYWVAGRTPPTPEIAGGARPVQDAKATPGLLAWDLTFPPEVDQKAKPGDRVRFIARVREPELHSGVEYLWFVDGREISRGSSMDFDVPETRGGEAEQISVAAVSGQERIERRWRLEAAPAVVPATAEKPAAVAPPESHRARDVAATPSPGDARPAAVTPNRRQKPPDVPDRAKPKTEPVDEAKGQSGRFVFGTPETTRLR